MLDNAGTKKKQSTDAYVTKRDGVSSKGVWVRFALPLFSHPHFQAHGMHAVPWRWRRYATLIGGRWWSREGGDWKTAARPPCRNISTPVPMSSVSLILSRSWRYHAVVAVHGSGGCACGVIVLVVLIDTVTLSRFAPSLVTPFLFFLIKISLLSEIALVVKVSGGS